MYFYTSLTAGWPLDLLSQYLRMQIQICRSEWIDSIIKPEILDLG